jgi:hypothetical protein
MTSFYRIPRWRNTPGHLFPELENTFVTIIMPMTAITVAMPPARPPAAAV